MLTNAVWYSQGTTGQRPTFGSFHFVVKISVPQIIDCAAGSSEKYCASAKQSKQYRVRQAP